MMTYTDVTRLNDLSAAIARGGLLAEAPTLAAVNALDLYCFTLEASLTQTFIGEIPGGFRIDLQYDPYGVLNFTFDSVFDEALKTQLSSAVLLTGTDWVSVTNDGVVSFDTRITLQVGPNKPNANVDQRCVIGAGIRGRTDLADCRAANGAPLFPEVENPSQIVSAWAKGFPADAFLPVALSVVFDVPTKGINPDQDRTYATCRSLERGLFVALGRANYQVGENSPLSSIRLDFMKLPFPPLTLDSDENRRASPRKEILGEATPPLKGES